ncbi:hypothetical protein [Nocardioides sp.]|uniref:hypothetical protein n=1 Tax=Nocardioides sp. TaxID=35761 RepID=UPI00351571AF
MQRSTTDPAAGVVPILDWVDVVDALRPFLARERSGMSFRFRGSLHPEGDVAGIIRAHDGRVVIRFDDERCLATPDRSLGLRRLAACLSGWGVTVSVAAGDVVHLQVPDGGPRPGWQPRVIRGGEDDEARRSTATTRAAIEAAIDRALDPEGRYTGANRMPEPRRLRLTWWDGRLKARGGARPRLRPVGLRSVGEDGTA